MNNWEEKPFAELLSEPVRNGLYKSKEFHGRGGKIINMGELFGHPRLRSITMKRLAVSPSEAARFNVEVGDLLFARRSLTAEGAGKCCVVLDVDELTVFESSIIRARPNCKLASPLFYFYYFESPLGRHKLDTIRRQVAVAGITGTDLSRLCIPCPKLSEQQAIASILGSLDDKIDLNRRMNETLESMARAIFKDWFVDFGPTRAKMEGRAPYLAPEVWELFPDRLDEEGKPEGWRMAQLGTIAKYLGRGMSPVYIESGGVLVLNQKCIRDRRIDSAKGRRHDQHRKSIIGRLIEKGDILINSTGVGTLGRVAQVMADEEPTIVDSHVTIVRANELETSWNHLGIDLTGREAEIEALGEGSTGQTELARSRLSQLGILLPPRLLVSAFDQITLPLREKETANDFESRTLAQTRDLLLPKLMSGEIRVKDAEKTVGTVL